MKSILRRTIPTLSVQGFPFPVDIGHVTENTFSIFLVVNDIQRLCATEQQNATGTIYSQTWYFHSLPWLIYIRLGKGDDGEKCLCLYLTCEIDSPTCTCEAMYNGSLLAYRAGNGQCNYKCKAVEWEEFSQKALTWGWPNFISWDNLTDPAHGYVKDNSFTVVVTVTAKPPKGV